MPTTNRRETRSFKIKWEIIPTKIGLVVTNTTDLVMEVYSREVIQRAKCNPKKNPDNKERRICSKDNWFNSLRRVVSVIGSKRIAANPIRYPAIIKGGTWEGGI
jgi:hypothetical protein